NKILEKNQDGILVQEKIWTSWNEVEQKVWWRFLGTTLRIPFGELENLFHLWNSKPGKYRVVEPLYFMRCQEGIWISQENPFDLPKEQIITPQTIALTWRNLRFQFRIWEPDENQIPTIKQWHQNVASSHRVFVKITEDSYPLIIRPWHAGEVIQLANHLHPSKISDVLTNQKYPSYRKKQAFVITNIHDEVLFLENSPVSNHSILAGTDWKWLEIQWETTMART
ncbi:MAG: hypothetical protein NZ108_05925, partial [Bacteroidia bacterium]|nr:hypothetical protein [Bacteroidia bacterium]